MPNDDHDNQLISERIPRSVRVAGIVWIAFGSLALIVISVSVILAAAGRLYFDGISVFFCLSCTFFLLAGVRTVRGKAKDVLGNSIGSIIVSLLFFAMAALLTLLGAGVISILGPGRVDVTVLIISFIVSLLSGLLMLAAVMALANRQAYLDWKHYNTPRQSRNDDYDD